MFKNIGKKIKTLAVVVFVVECIFSALAFIAMVAMAATTSSSEEAALMILAAIGILVLCPIVAWVSVWMLYGYGELIDSTAATEKNTRQIYEYLVYRRIGK